MGWGETVYRALASSERLFTGHVRKLQQPRPNGWIYKLTYRFSTSIIFFCLSHLLLFLCFPAQLMASQLLRCQCQDLSNVQEQRVQEPRPHSPDPVKALLPNVQCSSPPLPPGQGPRSSHTAGGRLISGILHTRQPQLASPATPIPHTLAARTAQAKSLLPSGRKQRLGEARQTAQPALEYHQGLGLEARRGETDGARSVKASWRGRWSGRTFWG